jgi:hypothetical protein
VIDAVWRVDEPVDDRRGGDAVAEHLAPRAEGLLLVMITPPRFATEGTAYLPAGQAERAGPILAHAVEVGAHLGARPAASAALVERSVGWYEPSPEASLRELALASDFLSDAP